MKADFSRPRIPQVEPDCETLIKLANFFNTTTDYILGRTNIRYPAEMTAVCHQNTSIADLPEEAIIELKAFTEYLTHKYKKPDKHKSSHSPGKTCMKVEYITCAGN